MVLQLEDCIDCLKVLFPNYNQQFLLDHLSSHAKKRLGGLDAIAMNIDYDGCQPKMYSTLIKNADGYYGLFHGERIYGHVGTGIKFCIR